jgi:hypothetical protein
MSEVLVVCRMTIVSIFKAALMAVQYQTEILLSEMTRLDATITACMRRSQSTMKKDKLLTIESGHSQTCEPSLLLQYSYNAC